MDIYAVNDIAKLIEGNSYVGRGIVIGKSADGKKACNVWHIYSWVARQTAATAYSPSATECSIPSRSTLQK